MHIIVLNDKDLEIQCSRSIENEQRRQSELGISTDAPTLSLDRNMLDNNKMTKKKTRKSLPEIIPAFGLLMSILSVFCFSVASLIVKVLTELHSLEILFIRCGFQLAFYIVPVIFQRLPILGVQGHRIDLAIRATFGTSAAICIYMAYRLIPLADATTIQFSSPVLAIIGAFFILKEPLTLLQIATGIITLGGVIVIAKPEFIFGSDNMSGSVESRTEGVIFAVVAAFSTATVMIILRKLKTTPIAVVVCWFSAFAMIGSMTVLLANNLWVWPYTWQQYVLLLGIGILGISDQFFMTIALHYESAGPVAITRTLNIVLAFVWDVLVLSQEFDWTSIVGACLVSACVLLLAICKWKQEKPEQFERVANKICCRSNAGDEAEDECDVLIVHKESIAFYDSIDDKMSLLKPPETEPIVRNSSFNNMNDVDGPVIMNKNSLV